MRMLITGGAGFQGSHLAEHFTKAGNEVTILNTYSEVSERHVAGFNHKVRVIWGSITDSEIVEKSIRGQDVVFHLAARINVDESIEQPWAYLDANVRGTYNILEAVRQYGCRLIHASTCEVYGAPVNRTFIPEDAELRPHSPYAASKAAADRLCFAYYKTYGVNVTIVRPFNIYGERQKEGPGGAAIAIMVRDAIAGKPIRVKGTGQQTRDYMHVSDVVKSYDLVFNKNYLAGEVINFGTGKETSIKSIAEYIAKRLNTEVQYVESRKGEVERFAADITKAKRLGFSPSVDIWAGINQYIEWRTRQRD